MYDNNNTNDEKSTVQLASVGLARTHSGSPQLNVCFFPHWYVGTVRMLTFSCLGLRIVTLFNILHISCSFSAFPVSYRCISHFIGHISDKYASVSKDHKLF